MTSIRPSMSGIPQTGPLQNVQRAQPAAKAEEAKAPPPKQETPAAAQDENKTKTFGDTPIDDVNAFPFEGEAKAADATSDIEGLFESSETEETDDVEAADSSGDVEETDEADDTDEPDDVEGGDDVEEAEPKEIEVEEEDEEEEEGGPDFDDAEGGEGGEGPERHIHIAPLLELVGQLRDLPRFRIEETWQVYGG